MHHDRISDHTNCRVHTRREARWEARAARGTGLSAEADWSSDTREWTRIYIESREWTRI